MNWELIGKAAEKTKGAKGKALKEADDELEDQEDEHVYHSTGWTRELWIKSLGMPAVLPPPEEEKDVKNRHRRGAGGAIARRVSIVSAFSAQHVSAIA